MNETGPSELATQAGELERRARTGSTQCIDMGGREDPHPIQSDTLGRDPRLLLCSLAGHSQRRPRRDPTSLVTLEEVGR